MLGLFKLGNGPLQAATGNCCLRYPVEIETVVAEALILFAVAREGFMPLHHVVTLILSAICKVKAGRD